MEATGVGGLSAINATIFHRRSLSPQINPSAAHFPLLLSSHRFSPLSSSSERCQVNALPNGAGVAVTEAPHNSFLQVVLVSPQIPGNTGSIARSCAASAVKLHLVEPLGYQVDDAKLKRAGMDYWQYVVVKSHGSWSEFRKYFMKQEGEKRLLAFTKKGTNIHTEFSYRKGDWLVFGSETSGLPPETYVRCLNLAVSVGIGLYEASRQLNYEQFQYAPEPCNNSDSSFLTEDIFA